MKLKLSQIIEAREPLKRLAMEKFSAHIAYRIQRNIRAIDPEARAYEVAREGLIKNKYGVKIEEGNNAYRVPPENVEEFAKEISLLQEEEVDVEITTLDLDVIHDITPMDMLALEWMFNAPKPEPTAQSEPRKRPGKRAGKE